MLQRARYDMWEKFTGSMLEGFHPEFTIVFNGLSFLKSALEKVPLGHCGSKLIRKKLKTLIRSRSLRLKLVSLLLKLGLPEF